MCVGGGGVRCKTSRRKYTENCTYFDHTHFHPLFDSLDVALNHKYSGREVCTATICRSANSWNRKLGSLSEL